MSKAKVLETEIEVHYSIRPDVGREFLTFSVPNGWDDVKKISRKVLELNGKKFAFTGWDSDKLQCYFARAIDGSFPEVAKIV